MSKEKDSTSRFSDRVEFYTRYRPGYPPALLSYLEAEGGLTSRTRVADIGSGTGILTRLLLEYGCRVLAVEPNGPMRAEAERQLASFPGFSSVAGRAEATTLPDHSVGLITAGQAFHWFDPYETRVEFLRILEPGGKVALIWNERQIAGTDFMQAYEQLLLRFGSDYRQVRHQEMGEEVIGQFFGPGGYFQAAFENNQDLDFAGLEGRLYSSSYAPMPGHPDHEALQAGLQEIFDRYHEEGQVRFDYRTRLYLGPLMGEGG